MKLINVNKARYRRHLNWLIVWCAGGLAIGSLSVSQILIAYFPDESGSHFHWNLLGVVVTALTIAYLLNKYRSHHFMTEVVYVWELKQALNKINRKIRKLHEAAIKGNVDALLALQFSYAGSRLLWELDDNTIVMDELVIKQTELDNLATQYQINLDVNKYNPNILQQF